MTENTLTDIEKRLLEFNALALSKEEEVNALAAGGTTASSSIPTPQTTPITIDPMDAVIQKYRSLERKLPDIRDIFRPPPKFDFTDDEWKDVPAYELVRYDPSDLVRLGSIVIPMMASGFSERGIGVIFLLAYNLRTPSLRVREYVFPDLELLTTEDMDIFQLSETPLVRVRDAMVMPAIGDDEKESMAYSFIAASMLRLFSKPAENYIRAFAHICSGFEKFYRFPFPINPPTPHIDALKNFRACISINKRCKATLYRILYMSGGKQRGERLFPELKHFLYETHLANTGLHLVGIFFKLCKVLNCETGVLLSLINNREFERQVNALIKLIGIITSPCEKYERKMWRFGRIFDDTFMSPLQTKTCATLTYTLASALKKVDSETNEGIFDIAQLADVTSERRRLLDEVAARIIRMITTKSMLPPKISVANCDLEN